MHLLKADSVLKTFLTEHFITPEETLFPARQTWVTVDNIWNEIVNSYISCTSYINALILVYI